MQSTPTNRAIVLLTEENPSYQGLIDLYNHLRTTSSERSKDEVTQYAIAQVVGEFIDYLDLVSLEFEKSIGITADQERERILQSFKSPASDDELEQVADLVGQWRTIERYSYENLSDMTSGSEPAIDNK